MVFSRHGSPSHLAVKGSRFLGRNLTPTNGANPFVDFLNGWIGANLRDITSGPARISYGSNVV